jgi:hypothetical protein
MRGRAAGILAGVLHVDEQAGEVFEQNLGGKARVTAGAAGRDDEVRMLAEERGDGSERLLAEGGHVTPERSR